MHDDADLDWELIAAALDPDASPDTKAALDAYLAAAPARAAAYARLQDTLTSALPGPAAPLDVARLEAGVRARLQPRAPHSSERSGTRRRGPSALSARRWSGRAIAAGVVATLLVAVTLPVVWSHLRPGIAADAPALVRRYATGAAQHSRIELPNGTRIHLAPETTVEYIQHRSGAQDVSLVGQATFSVRHDPAHAFTVHVAGVHVRVLGTTFDVRRYPADSITQVAVVEGRVTAATARTATILAAGMVGQLRDSASAIAVTTDASAATRWVDGALVFDGVPASAVLVAASRWSGYELRLTDSTLARQRVSTVLPVDHPERVLQFLKDLLGVTMTFDGHVVTLRPRTRVPHTAPAAQKRVFPPPLSSQEIGR